MDPIGRPGALENVLDTFGRMCALVSTECNGVNLKHSIHSIRIMRASFIYMSLRVNTFYYEPACCLQVVRHSFLSISRGLLSNAVAVVSFCTYKSYEEHMQRKASIHVIQIFIFT